MTDCKTIAEQVVRNGRKPNCHDVARIIPAQANNIRARLAALPPSPERELLAELVDAVLLLGGTAADGANTAYSFQDMAPGR